MKSKLRIILYALGFSSDPFHKQYRSSDLSLSKRHITPGGNTWDWIISQAVTLGWMQTSLKGLACCDTRWRNITPVQENNITSFLYLFCGVVMECIHLSKKNSYQITSCLNFHLYSILPSFQGFLSPPTSSSPPLPLLHFHLASISSRFVFGSYLSAVVSSAVTCFSPFSIPSCSWPIICLQTSVSSSSPPSLQRWNINGNPYWECSGSHPSCRSRCSQRILSLHWDEM